VIWDRRASTSIVNSMTPGVEFLLLLCKTEFIRRTTERGTHLDDDCLVGPELSCSVECLVVISSEGALSETFEFYHILFYN
jgi:hypothetical protein